MNKLAALIILDGFGMREETKGNAVAQANTPNFDRFWNQFPHNQLNVSGNDVGLPEGQMGNSEVGHLNIGAGRIVYQSLTRINKAIEDQTFYENDVFLTAMRKAKESDSALHLFGLLSDGGVHSHIQHLFALLELAKKEGLTKVYVHGFLDGRDVGPQTALGYIEQAEDKMKELGIGEFATISGRYYAMDRDKRWERVQLAYDAISVGKGPAYQNAAEAVRAAYQDEVYDEFVKPSVIIDDEQQPVGTVAEDDTIIFFNFRPDRAIQLANCFANDSFNQVEKADISHLSFVSMTFYSEEVQSEVAFEPLTLKNTLGEVLAENNLHQLRIAETEKYPHVTYFMNGGIDKEFAGEKRTLIHSPKVATYDLQPEMSAYEVTDALLEDLDEGHTNAIILNLANPDMVGHSGRLEPTIQAVETVDECLGKVIDKILALGGEAIITADHGNSDEVITMEDNPMTAHTTNPVPVIVTKENGELRDDGRLADLAPTLLELLQVTQPEEMTGISLLQNK